MNWAPLTEVLVIVAAHAIIAWTLTYLMHSTLVVAIAAAVDRSAPLAGIERVRLWRAALIFPIVTASLQFALPALKWLDTLAIDAAKIPGQWLADANAMLALIAVPVVFATIAVALLVIRLYCVRRRFKSRAFVEPDALIAELSARVGRRTPVISVSDRIVVPAAIGRREICLPDMIFAAMPENERRALLAHELGHIAARDPLWMTTCSVIAKSVPFQPLNRVALSRLREAAEHAADDFAVRVTDDRFALASGLTALSGVVVHMAGGAAATGSPVVRRVERLLDEDAVHTPRFASARWLVFALLAGAAFVAAAPGVRLDPDRAAQRLSWVKPSRYVSPRLMELRAAERRFRGRFSNLNN